MSEYRRYSISVQPAPNRAPHPSRFLVKVGKRGLLKHLIKELIQYRGNWRIVASRPCLYGVFSGPIGGFAPRSQHCVGCLRCTVEHPDFVQVLPNPERLDLGGGLLTPEQVDTLLYEAATGRVPVRGAGYRGGFGGRGWDAMWTDMSEIVRPTRDGIHGREFISTVVDLGGRELFLDLEEQGEEPPEPILSLSIPFLFDRLPAADRQALAYRASVLAAHAVDGMAIVPVQVALAEGLAGPAVAPLVAPHEIGQLSGLRSKPRMVELDGWDPGAFGRLRRSLPRTVIALRVPFGSDLLAMVEAGARVFHLGADYLGRTADGFVMEAIQRQHRDLVQAAVREKVTLIGSGGIVAAEHVPKAIISGLDAVALDTALLVALQGRLIPSVEHRGGVYVRIPHVPEEWAVQRLINLVGSWRDQMLEILGAMGMREVRRLRGEMGRAMLQGELEREAFSMIPGYLEAAGD
jgi:hypothetical protein